MKLDEVKWNESKNIVLIEWYDFKSETNPYIYGCSHLKLMKILNIVDIEAIRDNIHIISRFNKTNEYFVNKFIF